MSLLDTATEVVVEPEAPLEQEVVEEQPTPEGSGGDIPEEEAAVEHPEWFKSDKYESIEDQAKAYVDLESKFGAFVGAPDDGYAITPNEELNSLLEQKGMQPLESDDPLVTGMGEIAKELNMSQEGFNKFASKYIEYQIQTEDARIAQAIETIGEARINKVAQWGKANLSEAEFKLLEGATSSAEGVEFVELMMKQLRGEPDLSHKGVPSSSMTKEEIVSMQSKPEYKTDAAYRSKVTKAWEDYFKANPNG